MTVEYWDSKKKIHKQRKISRGFFGSLLLIYITLRYDNQMIVSLEMQK